MVSHPALRLPMSFENSIGIVACSYEGAALCYREICFRATVEAGTHPEISIHSHPFQTYVEVIERDDWSAVGELMLKSAEKLAQIGADFLICPDNTIHRALPLVRDRMPLPWLDIAEVVAKEAKLRDHRRVGILGTRWLSASDVYPSALAAHGIEFVRPELADRLEVSRIIMEELVLGLFEPTSLAMLQSVILELKDAGADAVVLGCTELPLVLADENSALPTLDSTRLLADAAVRCATGVFA